MGDIHIRIDEEPIIIRMEPASIYPIPFTSLTDAPTTYHDQANKFVKVKAAEDGLEFVVAAGLTDELVKYDAGDTVAGYLADKIIAGTGISLSEGTGADENKLKITGTGSYSLPIATGAALGGIKVGTRLTIDPVTGILSADVQTSSMTYPDAGIPLSTGTAWGTSIINNSGNWNTAYGWGNHAGLYLPISGAGDIYTHNASEFALTAHNHSGTYEVPLTFGSGVTRTVNAVANDLITGKAGGQTIYGDTATGGNLTISSTIHATKGKVIIGTSAYDEVNNRLGVGSQFPAYKVDVAGAATIGIVAFTGSGLNDVTFGGTYTGQSTQTLRIKITTAAVPDKFDWSIDGGTTWAATGVTVVAGAMALNYTGVTVTFAATTGHTANDYWQVTLTPATGIINNTGGYYIGASLFANTFGTGNTAVGTGAFGGGKNTSRFNTGIGVNSLYNNTTGIGNLGNGYYSLYSNTTGSGNVGNGYQSLYSNTTGSFNVGNGYQSLYSNTTGSYNVGNGYYSLYNNTTGIGNVGNGYNSLAANTTGIGNVGNGYNSLVSNTTGTGNVGNGAYSLYSNTTGIYNVGNGYYSLYSNTTGSYNVGNGYQSLYSNTTGSYNVGNGYQSLYSNTTGSYNVGNGYYSLYSNTTGTYNVGNGYNSLYSNTTGSYNVGNGYQSLYSNTTGSYNVGNGYYSLYSNTTGTNNVGNGYYTNYILPSRPTATPTTGGLVDTGAHNYLITYVINGIEHPSEWRAGTTTAVNNAMTVAGTSVYTGPQAITYKRIYRTLMAGGATATVTVSGGALVGGIVTAAGTGYQGTPVVTIVPKDAGIGGSFVMTVGGQGSAVEPTWNTTTGAYTLDNTITWICSGAAAGTEEVWKINTAYTYVSIATDTLTLSGTHSWATGQSIVYTTAGTSAIGNLTSGTRYFVILTGTGTEVKLATTLANAAAGTQIVLGAKTGTGAITLTPTYYVSGTASVVKNVAGTHKFTASAGGLLTIVASAGSGYTVAPTLVISKYTTNNPYRFYKIADLALSDTTYTDTAPDVALLTLNVPLPTGGSNSIMEGTYATATGSGQLVFGNSAYPITDSYFGGVFHSTVDTAGLHHVMHGMGGHGTNKAGGNLTIAGGVGTGTAAGGQVIFQTSPAAGAGTAGNTLVTCGTILEGKWGFGNVTAPSAMAHFPAGTATAGTAPVKLTSGPLLTTPEAGAIEFLTDGFYGTITTSAVRRMFVLSQTGRATAQTAANASVHTFTLPATDGSYQIAANVLVTTSSAEAFTVTCAYIDEGNTARTATLNFQLVAGTIGTNIAFANGAVPYMGIPFNIRCKASTAITIATTGTFTGCTYNVEAFFKKLA